MLKFCLYENKEELAESKIIDIDKSNEIAGILNTLWNSLRKHVNPSIKYIGSTEYYRACCS